MALLQKNCGRVAITDAVECPLRARGTCYMSSCDREALLQSVEAPAQAVVHDRMAASPKDSVKFTPLKLSGQWRKRTPPGFLGLDRVLDEVGRRERPGAWGRLPAWELMPFRYDNRRKAYRGQWKLALVSGKPVARGALLKSAFSRDELRACNQLYRSVCTRLIAAFEASELLAYALYRPSGDQAPITAAGIWSTQGEWAFYTGLVAVADAVGQLATARVLVREDDLGRWLQRTDDENAEERAKEARQRVGRAIRDFTAETGFRPIKKQVRSLCETAMGRYAFTPETKFDDVWGQIPASVGGNPGKAGGAAFEAHRERLMMRIREAWLSEGGAPAQG